LRDFLARGDTLLRTGDVASARLFYERAADAGDGRAALRLGATFDPAFLEENVLRGVRGDSARARLWYQRARDLGEVESENRLRNVQAK
jgi:TPR repeat protein